MFSSIDALGQRQWTGHEHPVRVRLKPVEDELSERFRQLALSKLFQPCINNTYGLPCPQFLAGNDNFLHFQDLTRSRDDPVTSTC